jgi:hypothetical protein
MKIIKNKNFNSLKRIAVKYFKSDKSVCNNYIERYSYKLGGIKIRYQVLIKANIINHTYILLLFSHNNKHIDYTVYSIEIKN